MCLLYCYVLNVLTEKHVEKIENDEGENETTNTGRKTETPGSTAEHEG
jgi:hypothetical protein